MLIIDRLIGTADTSSASSHTITAGGISFRRHSDAKFFFFGQEDRCCLGASYRLTHTSLNGSVYERVFGDDERRWRRQGDGEVTPVQLFKKQEEEEEEKIRGGKEEV